MAKGARPGAFRRRGARGRHTWAASAQAGGLAETSSRKRIPDGQRNGTMQTPPLTSTLPRRAKRVVRKGGRRFGSLTARFRLLPDYLIIGAQRAGTTSLFKYLAQHPAVGRPFLGKGAHFFDTNYSDDLDVYRAYFPTRAYSWYVRASRGMDLVTGEGSPYYLAHPHAPYRIAEALPEVKLIALLRDPVERAYSHYQHEVARGFEDLSFDEAIEQEPRRLSGELERMRNDSSYNSFAVQHHTYVTRGRYADQLEVWYGLFPRDQILLLRSEDLFTDPDRAYQDVLRFLGIPAVSLREYEVFNPRMYTEMPPQTRRKLVQYFAEPNELLYELVGIDFGWSR
jgi:Sulfotransferase domain